MKFLYHSLRCPHVSGPAVIIALVGALAVAGCQSTGEQAANTGDTRVTKATEHDDNLAKGKAAFNRGDNRTALVFLSGPVRAGNPEAQLLVGLIYWNRRGLDKEFSEAMRLFRLSAAQGNARAMNVIGHSYDYGVGVDVDIGKALKWYRKAVALNERRALNNLGILYKYGRGVPRDLNKTRELWLKAANLDHTNAMINLGTMFAEGKGVPMDMSAAERWWRRAASLGNNQAAVILGTRLVLGVSLKQNVPEGISLLRLAANAGKRFSSIKAARTLASLYGKGTGVKRDEPEATKWLEHAAGLGDIEAAINLGHIYNV